jgi:excisionase family DNA binding protein
VKVLNKELNLNKPENNSCYSQTYTVKEVSQMLNISVRKAYYFCSSTTEFKVLKIGQSIRVHKESFDSWLKV